MLHVAFAGTFPASLEQPVRRYLTIPCEIVVTSEADILPKMPEIDLSGDRSHRSDQQGRQDRRIQSPGPVPAL